MLKYCALPRKLTVLYSCLQASIKLYLDLMCNAIIDVKERREPTTAARQSGETEKDFVSSS